MELEAHYLGASTHQSQNTWGLSSQSPQALSLLLDQLDQPAWSTPRLGPKELEHVFRGPWMGAGTSTACSELLP